MGTLGFIGWNGQAMTANLTKTSYRLLVNDLRREVTRGLEKPRGRQF